MNNRPYHDEKRERQAYEDALHNRLDVWVASGGTEVPMLLQSGWHLYVVNFATLEHGVYCYADDVVYTGQEMYRRLGG